MIVNFNTRERLRSCLSALGVRHEIIVIDNASSDGSADMVAAEFPHAVLIANTKNFGFGAANNQGLDAMTGDLALLLNSDAEMTPEAIDLLASEFRDPGVVAAGAGQRDENGDWRASAANRLTVWAGFCEQTLLEKLLRFSPFDSYWIRPPSKGEKSPPTREVEQVMGACLMMRPVERFDERFFLYCEDTELCLRLRQHGRILYVASVTCFHALGASSSQDRWRSVARYNFGKELYFAIHHGRLASSVCFVFNRMGATLRLLIWGFSTLVTLGTVARLRVQAGLFWRVFTAPRLGPARPDGKPPALP